MTEEQRVVDVDVDVQRLVSELVASDRVRLGSMDAAERSANPVKVVLSVLRGRVQ